MMIGRRKAALVNGEESVTAAVYGWMSLLSEYILFTFSFEKYIFIL